MNIAMKSAIGLMFLTGVMTLGASASFADGYERVYSAQTNHYVYPVEKKTLGTKIKEGFRDAWRTPAVKKGLMGAGVGLGAAALAEKNLLRGSAIGAGIGAGMGLMDEVRFFNNHPLVRYTSKGALVGVGAAAATGAAALLPAAAVGAGVGAGIHYIKTR